MAHVNVKPAERTRVYETAEQAINHVFVYGVHANLWDFGGKPFGHTIKERRAVGAAIKARILNHAWELGFSKKQGTAT